MRRDWDHALLFVIVALAAFALAGCANDNGSTEGALGKEELPAITCVLAYRSTDSRPLEKQEEVVLEPGQAETITFDEVAVDLTYSYYETETSTLIIDSRLLDSSHPDKPVHRVLHQLDSLEMLSSEFAGGHGFTGLHYFSPPGSEAEAQFFCRGA